MLYCNGILRSDSDRLEIWLIYSKDLNDEKLLSFQLFSKPYCHGDMIFAMNYDTGGCFNFTNII